MQTLCPMNVHRRKTQKIEFQKKKNPAIVIITGNITTRSNTEKKLESCHGSSSNNNSEKPISIFHFDKRREREREEEKEERHKKARTQKLAPKKIDQLQLAACFGSENSNEQK
jgi:hypothetical protein